MTLPWSKASKGFTFRPPTIGIGGRGCYRSISEN